MPHNFQFVARYSLTSELVQKGRSHPTASEVVTFLSDPNVL